MLKGLLHVSVLLVATGLMGNSHAILLDRGSGLVYDTDQDLTWLLDTNIAKTLGYEENDGKLHETEIVNWVDSLEYAGYTDWRLPGFNAEACYATAIFYDATQCLTDDTSTSEITFMHNQILGNSFWLNRDYSRGCPELSASPDGCLVNKGADGVEFVNFVADYYWVTVTSGTGDISYSFNPVDGSHHENCGEFAFAYAWVVRSGDVSVPEPGTLLLLATGLIGLGVVKRHKT
jgi:hypothetical protein